MMKDKSRVTPHGWREIDVRDAAPEVGAVRVIDVREPSEYTGPLGHIEGAELVPLSTVVAAAGAWDRAQPLLLVCRSGARSAQAAQALGALGFGTVYNLTGGMMAWNDAQLPLAR